MNTANIAKEEHEKRREAIEYAHASLALEGFYVTEEEKKHSQKFIDGEIGLEEYVNGK